MKIKKIVLILLAVEMLLSFTACTGENELSEKTSPNLHRAIQMKIRRRTHLPPTPNPTVSLRTAKSLLHSALPPAADLAAVILP